MAWNDEQTIRAYGVRLSGSQMNQSSFGLSVIRLGTYNLNSKIGFHALFQERISLFGQRNFYIHQHAYLSLRHRYNTWDDSLLIELSSSTTAHN